MNNYLVKVKVRNGEYENSALSLVKASSENEACKVALLNQCHNDIGDGAEWIDSGISDCFGEFHYTIRGCLSVPEMDFHVLNKYI